jgi:hypothetical protein
VATIEQQLGDVVEGAANRTLIVDFEDGLGGTGCVGSSHAHLGVVECMCMLPSTHAMVVAEPEVIWIDLEGVWWHGYKQRCSKGVHPAC